MHAIERRLWRTEKCSPVCCYFLSQVIPITEHGLGNEHSIALKRWLCGVKTGQASIRMTTSPLAWEHYGSEVMEASASWRQYLMDIADLYRESAGFYAACCAGASQGGQLSLLLTHLRRQDPDHLHRQQVLPKQVSPILHATQVIAGYVDKYRLRRAGQGT